MRGVADRGHVHPAARQQLHGCRANSPGPAVDEYALPGANLRLLNVREGVVRAFGGRGGLRICQVRWDPGQRSVLADGQVLRVGAADSVVVPKDPVTDGEGRHVRAECLDLSGELVAEDLHPWPHQPGEGPDKERLGRPEAT